MLKINSICGEVWEGFKVSKTSELPKNAYLHKCILDDNCNTFNIYRSVAKKSTKVFIYACNQINY